MADADLRDLIDWRAAGPQPLLPFDKITRAHAEREILPLMRGIVEFQMERMGRGTMPQLAYTAGDFTSHYQPDPDRIVMALGLEDLRQHGMPLLPRRQGMGATAFFTAHEAGHAGDKRSRKLRLTRQRAARKLPALNEKVQELESAMRSFTMASMQAESRGRKEAAESLQKLAREKARELAAARAEAQRLVLKGAAAADAYNLRHYSGKSERFADRAAYQALRELNLPGMRPQDVKFRPGMRRIMSRDESDIYQYRRGQFKAMGRAAGMDQPLGGLPREHQVVRPSRAAIAPVPKMRGKAAAAQMLLDFLLD